MRIIYTIILTFIVLNTLAQGNIVQKSFITGCIVDSLNNDPIPFSFVTLSKKITTVSDLEGKFIFDTSMDSTVTLEVMAVDYKIKTVKLTEINEDLIIKLVPLEEFINWGKPIDTTYYKNGIIEKIKYTGRDEAVYYKTGQKKSELVDGSYRKFYKNGKLKYQSILKSNHHLKVTEWYDNGLIKKQGTKSWVHNFETNQGEWVKNNDWIFFDQKGKKIKNELPSTKAKNH